MDEPECACEDCNICVEILKEENAALRKEIEILRAGLIKTPKELHRISEGVKSWGFG